MASRHIINKDPPTSKRTTMKALADQAHRGLAPDRRLPVFEFGNGRVQRRDNGGAHGHYSGTFNTTTNRWE